MNAVQSQPEVEMQRILDDEVTRKTPRQDAAGQAAYDKTIADGFSIDMSSLDGISGVIGWGDRVPELFTGLAVVECNDGLFTKMLPLDDLQQHAVIAVLHGVEYTPSAKVVSSPVETVVMDVDGVPTQVVVDTLLPHRADLT